jgi:two-component system phosphate regulon response regulator PhoB
MMNAKILIVEDEPAIQELLAFNVMQAGFLALRAEDADSAWQQIRGTLPDLILLDWMLPNTSGVILAKQFRADARTKDIPIIMLTARGSEVDRVVGFELGADDYVVKPFSPRELVLRVQAILRREARDDREERIVFEPLVIDLGEHTVRLKGELLTLTATEFKLLYRLARRPGRAFSRDQLLSEVWGYSGDLETRTVDTHMKRLRAKLGDQGAWIETVRGLGYRFRPEGWEAAE